MFNPNETTNVQVWLDKDLYVAFKMKLAQQRRTVKDVITQFIVAYCDYKKEEDKNVPETQSNTKI